MQIPQTGRKRESTGNDRGIQTDDSEQEFAGQVARLVTTDPAEFEIALRPWELMCSPQKAGDFSHELVILRTPLFLMYKERFSLPLHIQGLTPPNSLCICIPMHIGREARYWGVSSEDGSLPTTLPGPLDAKVKAGHVQLILLIDLELMKSCLSDVLVEALVHAAEFHLMHVPPSDLRAFTVWGNRTLERFLSMPNMAQSPAALKTVHLELIDHLAMIAGALLPATDILSRPARQHGLQRALEYLRYSLDNNVTLSELCGIAEISERSLQYAFGDTFNLTPIEFMTRRRLHAVRQELLMSLNTEISVTQIAMQYGFSELGRFSNQYRSAFGELPSKTLARII